MIKDPLLGESKQGGSDRGVPCRGESMFQGPVPEQRVRGNQHGSDGRGRGQVLVTKCGKGRGLRHKPGGYTESGYRGYFCSEPMETWERVLGRTSGMI